MDLEAVFLCPLSSARLSIAEIPAGVAAQPSPKILATIFVEIWLSAGWFLGISGKRRPITGYIRFVRAPVMPDFSAIFIIPHHIDTIPHIVNAILTASFPDAITAFVNSETLPVRNETSTPIIIIDPQIIFIQLCPPPLVYIFLLRYG